ncbi:MAG: phosphonate C-P lyase system protein PhnG [Gammaproteobacteria bacterium]|nr:phosphonate C-P lyase system protein PhnG [Gammaproteobacteria bacterium]MBU1414268.1 phosphonate C-P lyase system protein PhnG [Gammaproteobacteria bacterium]
MTNNTDRRGSLGLLARSPATLLAERMARVGELPSFTWLRKPETGMVMLRGRIGGDGARFNLGEATMTRCTLRLADGSVGVGTVRGRNARHAEMIALCDAMLQQPARAATIRMEVMNVLAQAEQERHARASADTAGSRVDFYTLVRGED